MRYGGAVEKHDENGVATAGRRTQANPDAAEGIAEPGHGDSAGRTTSILPNARRWSGLVPVLVLSCPSLVIAVSPCRCRSRTYVALASEREGRARGVRSSRSPFVLSGTSRQRDPPTGGRR